MKTPKIHIKSSRNDQKQPLTGSAALLTPSFSLAALSLSFLLSAASSQAAINYWNGTDGIDWNVSTNPPWTAAKPTSSGTAVFNTTLSTVANAVADQSVGSIWFDTNAGTASGSFTVGTTGGNKLILAQSGATTILSTLNGTGKTISVNSPIVLTPASSTTNGSYTFSNYATDTTNTLNFGGSISAGTTSGTETLALKGTNTGSNVISGVISNGGAASLALTKSEAGRWILTGANTYTGLTTVSSGTLQIGNGGTVGSLATSGTISISSGAALAFNRSDTVTQGVDFSAAAINGGATSTLVQAGSGTLVLVATNNKAGTIIINEGGTLQIGDGSAANSSLNTTTSIVTNGTLKINKGSASASQAGTLAGAIISGTGGLTHAGTAQFTLSLANTYSGVTSVTGAGGTLSLTNALAIQNSTLDTSGAGRVTLAGAGYPAQTFGGLIGSTNLATFISGNYNLLTSLTLNPGAGVSNTYSGVISNGAANMTLTKTGAGTQVLSGSNTYTGATTINGGLLKITGSLDSASTVTVNTNGTLGGSGKTGKVVLAGGLLNGTLTTGAISGTGLVTPGNSAGILTATSVTSDASTSGLLSFAFELKGTGPDYADPANTLNDVLHITSSNGLSLGVGTSISVYLSNIDSVSKFDGGFFVDGMSTLDLTSAISNSTFHFFALDGLGTVNTSGSDILYNGLYYTSLDSSDISVSAVSGGNATFGTGSVLEFAVVPEPGTWVMLTGGLGMLAFGQRLRRRSSKA